MDNKIKILATSDIHGYIYPYSYADGEKRDHGLAKLKTLIDSIRDENTILIENGDVLEGSPFTMYHYQNRPNEINPLSVIMKEMKYDFTNVGNHDFNYGEEALFRHYDVVGGTLLTANVLYKGKQLGPDYIIRNILGKKLAFFGVTTHFVPKWEDPEHILNYEFIDAFESTKRIVKEIKEKEDPDYIVCVYHGGFENDPKDGSELVENTGENQGYRMLKEIGGIDIIVAGHQHATVCGTAMNCAYAEPAFYGAYLECFTIDPKTNEITPELLEASLPADEKIMAIAQNEENEVQKWLDTKLGYTDKDMRIHDEYDVRLHKSQLATLINKIQLEYTGADLSGVAIFLNAKGFYKDITMRDVVSTYFYPNTLVVKKVNGKILKEYLEACARFWAIRDDEIIIDPLFDFPTPQHHNYDMIDGVEYTIKVSNPIGSRIISLKRNGQDVKDDDEFSLVINNYRAGGSGGFNMIKEAETLKEIQKGAVEVIGEYMMSHQNIEFEDINNITVIK